MVHSKGFIYVKNQFLMGNFSPDDLIVLVSRNVIRDDERLELLELR